MAFPKALERAECDAPRVTLFHERERDLPALSAYLAPERRLPSHEDGIFRHYPELKV